MASLRAPPTYEDYAACVPQENRYKLAEVLDFENGDVDLHLNELALLLVGWEELATYLHLTGVDVSDIHSDHLKVKLQRIDALRKSKSALAYNATYGTYLRIFVEHHKVEGALECAKKIVTQLGATDGPSQQSPSYLPSSQPHNGQETGADHMEVHSGGNGHVTTDGAEFVKEEASDGNGCVSADGAEFRQEEDSAREVPLLSLQDGEDKYFDEMPQNYPEEGTEECNEVKRFSTEVDLILLTINEHEYHAAALYMKKPSDKFDRAVFVPGYGTKVVGMFARIKTALIQSDVGANSDEFIQHAIDTFPNARFVIAVGVCFALDRSKHQLGDVIVSNQICNLLNSKFKGGAIINRGPIVEVVKELTKFCMNRAFRFLVTDKRHCKVDSGKMASLPFLIDEEAMQEAIKACVSEAIGGEMEGGQLLKFHPKKGVIIIKGVVDYGDGEKSKEFQFISAMAAVHYTHFKLKQAPL